MKIKHTMHAEWIDGQGIVITETTTGTIVPATFGATSDNRTCHCHAGGLHFGWNWPSPPLPFKSLINCINSGFGYASSSDCPSIGGKGSRGPRNKRR